MAKPTSPGKALDHAAEQALSVLNGVPPINTPPEPPELPDHPEFPDTSVALPAEALPLPEQTVEHMPSWLLPA